MRHAHNSMKCGILKVHLQAVWQNKSVLIWCAILNIVFFGVIFKILIYIKLGWQCQDLCLSAPPPKRQTFLSVADMLQMLARHVGNILLCWPIFWLSVLCRGILLPTKFPTCKQESVLVRYVLLLLHACRNLGAIKLLSHSPPFDQRNWFGVIGGSLIALVALGLGTYKTPQLWAKPQSVMTPIRHIDQRERLGDYNISCGASEELDNN
jgi:hypothetical protein